MDVEEEIEGLCLWPHLFWLKETGHDLVPYYYCKTSREAETVGPRAFGVRKV